MSVAMEIARIAERKLGDQAPLLSTVAVEVGDDSGIEPWNLEFCLEAVFRTPPFMGAKPEILRRPGDVLQLAYLEIDDGRPDD
jgi:Zn finger protein HypA/HybF involved in hydrogenase expression